MAMQPVGPASSWPRRTVGSTGFNPPAALATVPPPQAPGTMRFAFDPKFMSGLKGLARVGGVALAGAPIVLGAVGELQNPDDNATTNLAAAGGNAAGGIGGGLLAAGLASAISGPAAPIVAPIAFGLGAMGGGALGGMVARPIANAVQGITNDPLDKELRDSDKRALAMLRQKDAEAAMMERYAELSNQRAQQNAALANQLQQSSQFQAALLNAASGGVDANTLSFLQGLA